jgi:hypothetical protein
MCEVASSAGQTDTASTTLGPGGEGCAGREVLPPVIRTCEGLRSKPESACSLAACAPRTPERMSYSASTGRVGCGPSRSWAASTTHISGPRNDDGWTKRPGQASTMPIAARRDQP